jgi:parvulin-like peptidyl-prolyl isomerase
MRCARFAAGRTFVALCAAALLLAGAACRSNTAPAPATPASPDTWALVDGREIKRDAVEKAYARMRDMSQTLSEEEAMAAKLSLLNDLIVEDLLIAKAQQLKIELADTEVDNAYAEASKNIAPAAFQEELTRRSLTAADMREGLRRELLTQKVIEQEIGSKVAVTEQEIADFFNAKAYHLAQIVVTPVREPQVVNRSGDDAATPQAAAQKTQMIMERLKMGASFRDLAMDYSEDPDSAPRGGDLGFVPISRLKQAPPPLRDAVLNMKPGTANVVPQNGAYAIVLVVGREAAGQRDLSVAAVREQITQTLRGRREQLLRAAYLTALRTDANVENFLARRLIESQGKTPSLQPAAPGTK